MKFFDIQKNQAFTQKEINKWKVGPD